MDFASSNQENRAAAETIFKQKFTRDSFEIIGEDFDPNPRKLLYYPKRKPVDFDVMLKILELFGHLITKLKLNYQEMNQYQCETINQHLNKFSVKSLTEIIFLCSTDTSLIDLDGPFPEVIVANFTFGSTYTNASTKFYEKFPALQKLVFNSFSVSHSHKFEHNFPHLHTWHFDSNIFREQSRKSFEKRMELNPQLRHVTFQLTNWHLLKIISEKLPQLESIDIKRFLDNPAFEGRIEFTKLKAFEFREDYKQSYSKEFPLVFGNLEVIECYEPVDKWFEVIMQNTKLGKVRTGEISDEQLFRIAETLPDLQDFTTDHKVSNFSTKVLEFIAKASNLKRVVFTQANYNTSKTVLKELGDNWKLGGVNVLLKIRN